MAAQNTYTILLVDDSEVTQEIYTALLGSHGYRIETATSGDQALEVLKRRDHGIDLVLLDLVMPGKDGYETLREIRRSYSKESLPVFVVTAKEGRDDILRAFEEGADDFLAKPLKAGISLSKIDARLQLRSPRSSNLSLGPGDIIGSKYRLDELVGSGGFGTVFRARHVELDVDIAIKVLHDRIFADFDSRKRLRTEGRALAKLNHPNTVRVWDLVTAGDPPFLAMDFLEGHNLAEEMSRRGPMSPSVACHYAAQIAAGLRAAHRLGIQHRDIKPQNIFLCQRQQGSQIKLLDFGLAAIADEKLLESGLTMEGELMGSPRYMPPERITGEKGSEQSDIYSFGVVFFEMLSGMFPYSTSSDSIAAIIRAHSIGKPRRLSDLGVDVPASLEDLILGTLARDPDRRPDSETLVDELTETSRQIRDNPVLVAVKSDPSKIPDTEPIDLAELNEEH